jgi:hypothetical protein
MENDLSLAEAASASHRCQGINLFLTQTIEDLDLFQVARLVLSFHSAMPLCCENMDEGAVRSIIFIIAQSTIPCNCIGTSLAEPTGYPWWSVL